MEKLHCKVLGEQDQGASVQKTVWTVYRCIHDGILSPVLVVVDCTGLYWAVLGYTGLYWAVLGFTGLYWAVLGCTGLYWAVLGCTGLY